MTVAIWGRILVITVWDKPSKNGQSIVSFLPLWGRFTFISTSRTRKLTFWKKCLTNKCFSKASDCKVTERERKGKKAEKSKTNELNWGRILELDVHTKAFAPMPAPLRWKRGLACVKSDHCCAFVTSMNQSLAASLNRTDSVTDEVCSCRPLMFICRWHSYRYLTRKLTPARKFLSR